MKSTRSRFDPFELLMIAVFVALGFVLSIAGGGARPAYASNNGHSVHFDKVTCASTITRLPSHEGATRVQLFDPTGGIAVGVGDAAVANSTSYPQMAAAGSLAFNASNSNQLYCITATSQVVPFSWEE